MLGECLEVARAFKECLNIVEQKISTFFQETSKFVSRKFQGVVKNVSKAFYGKSDNGQMKKTRFSSVESQPKKVVVVVVVVVVIVVVFVVVFVLVPI